MSVNSGTPIIRHFHFCRIYLFAGIVALLFTGRVSLGQEFQSGPANEYYSNEYQTLAPSSTPEDLPKVRSLGKLVSIEGKVGDKGSLRPLNRPNGEMEFESGIEMPSDPLAASDELHLPKLSFFRQEAYANYRIDENNFSYMPGNGDQFGWITIESLPYLKRGYRSGITTGVGMHLLAGPNVVPLPPRLYDFSLGYQSRGTIKDFMSYDLGSSIGVFSDFEDSARDGIRFPGHAVGMLHWKPEVDFVFGIDYLSRDDIKLLPVGGLSWRPFSMQDLRFDLVFPRPRIDYSIDNEYKIYLAGRLGGGTWDIEFPNNDNDVMTVRELQLVLGFEQRGAEGDLHVWEFGYVFDRQLQFRTLVSETNFDDAFVFRMVTRH